MPGPWDKYQSAQEPTAGPWAKYATPGEQDKESGLSLTDLVAGKQPKQLTIRPGMTDDDIIKSLGYDPNIIKASKFYQSQNWLLSKMGHEGGPLSAVANSFVADPNSKFAKIASGPLMATIKGIANVGEGIGQLQSHLMNKLGAESTSDMQYKDMMRKLQDTLYNEVYKTNTLAGKQNNLMTKGVSSAYEILGEAAPSMLVPGAGSLRGVPLLSKAGMVALGKTALTGAATAVAQPVDTASDQSFGQFAKSKTLQAGLGGILAPAGQLALEKVAMPLARGVWNTIKPRTPDLSNIEKSMVGELKGTTGTVAQADMEVQKAAARAQASIPFQELQKSGGTVDFNQQVKEVDDLIARVSKSGDVNRDAVVSDLAKIRSLMAEDGGKADWEKALQIGTSINEMVGNAKYPDANGKVNNSLLRILAPVKELHQQALDTAGKHHGDLYIQAKEGWKQLVVPWENPDEGARSIARFMHSPTPNDAMRALTLAGPDQAKIIASKVGPNGKNALAAGLVEAAFNESEDKGPKALLKALNRREALYDLTLSGEAKFKMDGYKKLLSYASTLDTLIPFDKWGLKTSEAVQKLFTTKAGSRFLLGLSAAGSNPTVIDKMVTQLPKIIGSESSQLGNHIMDTVNTYRANTSQGESQ